MRRAVLMLVCCAAAAAAGCGGGGDDRAAPPVGAEVRLAAAYRFPGPRQVDARLRAEGVADPARAVPVEVPVAAGSRLVQVVLSWTDRGRDPLPWDALRFTLTDDAGRRRSERFRVPPQRIRTPDGVRRRGLVGFALPAGRRARTLTIGSIIAGAPLRATLPLPTGS